MTLIELIWTITPALILIAIAFPSFRLLYLLDSFVVNTALIIKINIIGLKSNFYLQSLKFEDINNNINSQPKLNIKFITNIKTECKEIISFGSVYSSIGIILNQHCRNITEIPSFTREQIIGHLLGDGGITYSNTSITPYFYFTQAFYKFEYLWFVFNKLSFLCSTIPDYSIASTLR